MKTKVKARFTNGEIATMIINGPASIGDRVRTFGSMAEAVVVEIVQTLGGCDYAASESAKKAIVRGLHSS